MVRGHRARPPAAAADPRLATRRRSAKRRVAIPSPEIAWRGRFRLYRLPSCCSTRARSTVFQVNVAASVATMNSSRRDDELVFDGLQPLADLQYSALPASKMTVPATISGARRRPKRQPRCPRIARTARQA